MKMKGMITMLLAVCLSCGNVVMDAYDARWGLLTFENASVPGQKVAVAVGGVEFKMIYANNQASITFPFSPSAGTPVDTNEATITTKFFLAETEVTWAVWKEVFDWAVHADRGANMYTFQYAGRMGSVNGGAGMTGQHPVTMVSWRDAVIWCNALSEMTGAEPVYIHKDKSAVLRSSADNAYGSGINVENVVKSEDDTLTRKGYRLPTSKEWEYTARYVGADAAGRTDYVSKDTNGGHADLTKGYYWTPAAYASGGTGPYTGTKGNDYPHFNPFAWYGNSITVPDGNTTTTQPVADKTPNALGIYDMNGNVNELCFTVDGFSRVIRGGQWSSPAAGYMRIGVWDSILTTSSSHDFIGFRLTRTR